MRKPMTQKIGKRGKTRKPKRAKAYGLVTAAGDAQAEHDDHASKRGVRGREDPSLWCQGRFWWGAVRAHRCTPVAFKDRAQHFLGHLTGEDLGRAKLALKRVEREGTDPSAARGDLCGASFVSLIGGMPGYIHTMAVFDSPVWALLGPEGVGPDALVHLQDTLSWELVAGVRYVSSKDDPYNPRRVILVRMSRLHCKTAAIMRGRLGSREWRGLKGPQFIEAVRLLGARPSWPGLSMLCVFMLRMGDSDARLEVSTVRAAIKSCMAALGTSANVDPRAAAVFNHLVRRRILSALRTLEHAAPALEWARGQLFDLEYACRGDDDRRWHARQVDALACALGDVWGHKIEWLGRLPEMNVHLEPPIQAVLRAIRSDERAQRLLVAQVRRRSRAGPLLVQASP